MLTNRAKYLSSLLQKILNIAKSRGNWDSHIPNGIWIDPTYRKLVSQCSKTPKNDHIYLSWNSFVENIWKLFKFLKI